MSSPLGPIAAGVLDMFAPLNRALHDPDALRLLLYNLGWEAEIEAALLEEEPYASLAAEVADLIDQGTLLVRDLTDSDGDNDAAFEALLDVIATLRAFVADLSQIDGLPPGITDPGFWAQLALDLPEYLVVRYLERYQAVLYALLRLGGVIEDDPDALAGSNGRPPYVRRRIVWDNLVGFIGGPADHLQALYHWGDGRPFDHARLLDELARFGAIAGVRFERLTLRRTIVDDFYGATRRPTTCARQRYRSSRAVGGVYAEQGVLVAPVPPSPSGDDRRPLRHEPQLGPGVGGAGGARARLDAHRNRLVRRHRRRSAHICGPALSISTSTPSRPAWRSPSRGCASKSVATARHGTGPRVELGGLRARDRFVAARSPT